ncbi:guanylate kinase [Intestinimonas butyriciproducens]|uniref:guanylate kinase n=1 Tax=Intestinimonas butyriciproducens TaxID=1297617 RepID=UPI00195BA23E|nr:guanylate kinase [Intestinimonas butyriciproducens]MBM6918248.1 guanylate kinase [Intestinimonas butyriciproducens]
MSKGNLFIVTGPSGAGKGTVLGRLLPSMEQLQYSVSATTRAPREGEEDGVNYYFLNRNDFLNMVDRGEFLEYAEYVGNFYGTPAGPVDECLEKGVDVILEIEVQGALTVKSKRPEAKLVFIIPPTFADLELRLRSRGSESDEVIAKRLEKAKEEYSMANHYDYIVCNGEVEQAVEELRSIIKAARCTVDRRINLLR